MRQPGAAALAQDHGAIAVERKAFSRIDEREVRRGVDGLLRGSGPELRGQHVAGDQLIAHLGIQIGAQQRLLRDRFLLGAAQFAGSVALKGRWSFFRQAPSMSSGSSSMVSRPFSRGPKSAQRLGAGETCGCRRCRCAFHM